METAESPNTTVAATAEMRATTAWNQFVWGILFAVVSFGMISGEYTALKYISICAATLLCVWVARQEKPAPATVDDQPPAADEHGTDNVTEVSLENLTQLDAVTGALVLEGPAAPACTVELPLPTFDVHNIYNVIDEFLVELTLLEDMRVFPLLNRPFSAHHFGVHTNNTLSGTDASVDEIDSMKGALVLYRPLSHFLPVWVTSLPETIDRDWVEFPAPVLPKPCDSIDQRPFSVLTIPYPLMERKTLPSSRHQQSIVRQRSPTITLPPASEPF